MGRYFLKLEDGRKLFTVHPGKSLGPAQPVALYDAGAFGIYADATWVAQALSERGVCCISYSRAGLFPSDPVPSGIVPTSQWHADQMALLLDRLGVDRPILLIGHSMAGLRAHAFANQYPERLAGVVLIDAVTPVQLKWTVRRELVRAGVSLLRHISPMADTRVSKKLVGLYPNNFELTGKEREDKVTSFSSASHLRASSIEVQAATDPKHLNAYPPITHCPVASISATIVARGDEIALKAANAAGQWTERMTLSAGHASILSPAFVEPIADLAMRVLANSTS